MSLPPPPVRLSLAPEGMAGQLSSALTGERLLVIEAPGFGLDTRELSFRVPWSAVGSVLVVHEARSRGGELLRGTTDDVQLVVHLVDEEPVSRQPHLAALRGVGAAQGSSAYGVLLGPVPHLLDAIASAMTTFAGPLFLGVRSPG